MRKSRRTLISMVMVTTKIETIAEFQKKRRNWFEVSIRRSFERRVNTHHGLVAAEISALLFSDVISM